MTLSATNMRETFQFLTQADWDLLLEGSRRLQLAADEVLVAEGERQRDIFIVREGFVRIELGGDGVAVNQLGPGEVIGEVSFIEGVAASADVVAGSDVTMDAIAGERLKSLLASEPAFASRFYRSLAVTLSARLRRLSHKLARLGIHEVAQIHPFHRPRTGHVTERQIPPRLVETVDRFHLETFDVERSLRNGTLAEPEAVSRVARCCEDLLEHLVESLGLEQVVEMGYRDLLSFSDRADLVTGIGAFAFRQSFSVFMSSATAARYYMKPRGFVEDFTTLELAHENDPDGDGVLGPIVDGWFLARPVCEARRRARHRMREFLADMARAGPLRVTNLASGRAPELFDFLEGPHPREVDATCIDLDALALSAAAKRSANLPPALRPKLVKGNVVGIATEAEHLPLPPQHLIYTLGFLEQLDDDPAVTLLDWIHRRLEPGGRVVVSHLTPGSVDQVLMQHVLEWHIAVRTANELGELFRRSAFRGGEMEVEDLAGGAGLLMICTTAR